MPATLSAAPLTLTSLKRAVHGNRRHFINLLNLLNAMAPLERLPLMFSTTLARRSTLLDCHRQDWYARQLLSEPRMTTESLESFFKERQRGPLAANNPTVNGALIYIERKTALEWLENLERALNDKSRTMLDVYTTVVMLGVSPHRQCTCLTDTGSRDMDVAGNWMHAHHGDFNRLVHEMLVQHRLIAPLRRVWEQQSSLPADKREADSDYHVLLEEFLQDNPRHYGWFTNAD